MVNEVIGEMAGKVWHELHENGGLTAAKLKSRLKADTFVINAALGWLAREDKIELAKSGNTIKAELKEEVYA